MICLQTTFLSQTEVMSHWNIESMHWTLGVVFKEDASVIRKGNIPVNLAMTRRFILNILNGIKKGD